ncbi:MAG TPA: hypothetical protein VFH17_02285, partial [Coriobacteriia bacterium]|nr:hypothetical protein [Coriobacteriia bacterium]
GCLTCHRAHGTSATMSGWAVSTTEFNTATGLWGAVLTTPTAGVAGVEPTLSSALLRHDNRGVCQRCHNQ